VGGFFFWIGGKLLFGLRTYDAIAGFREGAGLPLLWGLPLLISMVLASWSVGRALLHTLRLLLTWLTLYEAGGK